jgi:hypothetical protein
MADEDLTAGMRRELAHLHHELEHTRAVEARILAGAEDRLASVRREADRLRPKALASDEAAARYEALGAEAGRLEQVIARARARLA